MPILLKSNAVCVSNQSLNTSPNFSNEHICCLRLNVNINKMIQDP